MNENVDPFAGLEDKAFWEDENSPGFDRGLKPSLADAVAIPGFVEDCPKCRGTGTYFGRSRHGHKCFKCKGTGKLQFKTSPEARQRSRKSAQKSKANRAEASLQTWLAWLEQPEQEVINEWLVNGVASRNTFAMSLYEGGRKYGHLTDGQIAAVYKAVARDADSAAGFEAWCAEREGVLEWLTAEVAAGNEFAGSLLTAGKRYGALTDGQLNAVMNNIEEGKTTSDAESALDLSVLVKGYYAVPDGDTRLKVAIRRPGKNSRWFGWTFVDDGAAYGSRKTYGKQAPEGTYAGSIQDQLRAIIADPMGAMIEYGKLTGTCGKCGRILEDEESVAAGIGPICARKMS